MNLRRAIGTGIVTYILSFAAGMLAAQMTSFDPLAGDPVPMNMWLISIGISFVLVFAMTMYYLKGVAKPSAEQGFYFGMTLLGVGIVMDGVVFLAMMASDTQIEDAAGYYGDPMFWVSVGAMILATVVAGAVKGAKK